MTSYNSGDNDKNNDVDCFDDRKANSLFVEASDLHYIRSLILNFNAPAWENAREFRSSSWLSRGITPNFRNQKDSEGQIRMFWPLGCWKDHDIWYESGWTCSYSTLWEHRCSLNLKCASYVPQSITSTLRIILRIFPFLSRRTARKQTHVITPR